MIKNSEVAGFILASILGILFIGMIIWRHVKYPIRKGYKADPLAEAEVYIAYGQTKRAIKILEKAQLADPSRQELTKKLNTLKDAQ